MGPKSVTRDLQQSMVQCSMLLGRSAHTHDILTLVHTSLTTMSLNANATNGLPPNTVSSSSPQGKLPCCRCCCLCPFCCLSVNSTRVQGTGMTFVCSRHEYLSSPGTSSVPPLSDDTCSSNVRNSNRVWPTALPTACALHSMRDSTCPLCSIG